MQNPPMKHWYVVAEPITLSPAATMWRNASEGLHPTAWTGSSTAPPCTTSSFPLSATADPSPPPAGTAAAMIVASPGILSSFPTTQPAMTFLENFATSSSSECSAPPSPKPFPHTKPHSHTKSSRQAGSADA